MEIKNNVKSYSDYIANNVSHKSKCKPVDRYVLDNLLPEILYFDPNEFIRVNLNSYTKIYSVRLLICLPEVWLDDRLISISEIVDLLKGEESFLALIEILHKYFGVNPFDAFINSEKITKSKKVKVLEYYINKFSWIIMDDVDKLFFTDQYIGLKTEDFNPVKNKLHNSNGLTEAFKDEATFKNSINNYLEMIK